MFVVPFRRIARRLAVRLRRRTVRFRLTLLYGGLFLAAGIAVLSLTYLLVTHATGRATLVEDVNGTLRITPRARTPSSIPSGINSQQLQQLRQQSARQHESDLHQLLIQSGIALVIAALLAFAAGWFVAGRVLRPLRAMTTTTQRISQDNLHHRLALTGPSDEIKDLADTIDGLLGRLETAFDAQRRFIANVSHELRTPLTWERALAEVALADPHANTATLRGTIEDILDSNQDQERLIEALLTLATSERGLDQREPVDLTAVTRDVLQHRPDPIQLHAEFGVAWTTGNPALLKRLIGNLVDNAVRHNHDRGRIEISSRAVNGRAVLTVANPGTLIDNSEIARLLLPFERLTGARTSHPDGHGLGLSIVAAITAAHDGDLRITPRPNGGLCVTVTFPEHRPPPAARSLRGQVVSAGG